MKFRTEITPPAYPFQIGYNNKILLIGSCFSDHIGSFFERSQFTTLSNPVGVLFNPASIAMALRMALSPEEFNESYIHFVNGFWVSFAHHGKFSHPDKNVFLRNITQQLDKTYAFLQEADYLFITLGTAYYYRHIEKDKIVANCHKIPGYEFEKKRLTVEEIEQELGRLLLDIKAQNKTLRIIFTVSPVRHLGNGFHENQLSKSILHLAVDRLVDNETCFYLPSYEIMLDDLRDYRFYANDLCHPGEQGIAYIREKVKESFFSEETLGKLREIEKGNRRNEHILLKPQSSDFNL